MELLTSFTSPFARKVRILIIEGNIPCKVTEVVPWTQGKQVSAINPLRKIPLLKVDDHLMLMDSKLICQYLDENFLQHRFLHSNDPKRKYSTLNLALLAEGLIEAMTAITMMDKVLENTSQVKPKDWHDWQFTKVTKALAFFDSLSEFSTPRENWNTIVDVIIACGLDYLDFRLSKQIDWRTQNKNLAKCFTAFEKIPSFTQTSCKLL